MDINTPEDFREQPVIDIEVEFVGGGQNAWTINDEPDNQIQFFDGCLNFRFLTTKVSVVLQNVLWFGTRRRIDRIPIKTSGAPHTPSPATPEGGEGGSE